MIIRNPSGRTVKLDVVAAGVDAALSLEIGPNASVDLDRYQRALDALADAGASVNGTDPDAAPIA